MTEVIAVVSGKGGVGKTTTTANIGTALASMGHKVLLIDGDVGLRNLDISLGMQDRVVYHFLDVMQGVCKFSDAVIVDDRYAGLNFLSAPHNANGADIDKEGFRSLVDSLRSHYDYIIIDCAAGIDDSFVMASLAADRAIIVSTPELISIRDADCVAARLEGMGLTNVFLIINRINIDMIKKGDMIDIDTIMNTVAVPLIGAVPDDSAVTVSNNRGRPVVLSTKLRCGMAFLNIAKRILGKKVPILKDEKKGLFGLFKR